MRKATKKQIEQIKAIKDYQFNTSIHGNRKRIGRLTVEQFKEIAGKKYNRRAGNYVTKSGKVVLSYQFKRLQETPIEQLRDLIEWSIKCKGTSYFKRMIEGNTGIYYASPSYGHSDYNKTRLFDKTPENLKLMHLFNAIVYKEPIIFKVNNRYN